MRSIINSVSLRLRVSLLTLPLFAALVPSVEAGERAIPGRALQSSQPDTTDRLIVRFRDQSAQDLAPRLARLGNGAGVPLTHLRAMSGGAHVVRLAQRLSNDAARALAQRLAADPNVLSVEADLRMYPQLVPNDPRYPEQWHYYEAAGGIDLPAAWDITTGSPNIVVAVVDTGVLPHADLAGRLTGGYDFISDSSISNDGDGRDGDASDSGDYGCSTGGSNSSWHGTHVAGTIGAASNNALGVTGINWTSKILPVRVLGKCGGYTSDIVDGMRWAAGLSVPNIPANPTPARVENLSFGGLGACSATFQNAVNAVLAQGTVIVVAAGNDQDDASRYSPGNCAGVITVAATTRAGGKAYFTNTGSKVTISAPGTNNILSTLNTGTTIPVADTYVSYQGTSMATPHVAGVASLMLSVNPSLTPAQVVQKLQQSARAFPTGTGADCTTALCGAGIVDAAAAVASVGAPTTPARTNVALASNGGVASASSIYSSAYPVAAVNNGDRRGLVWGNGGGWNDATGGSFPDWVQVAFSGSKTIDEIDVFTLQDNISNPQDPTETLTFSQYGLSSFEVEYWNGSAWIPVSGGNVSGNNKVWNKFSFAPVSTSAIRVWITNALASYSRVIEVEAYSSGTQVANPPMTNVALQSNGGVASASSTYNSGFPVAAVNNGDRRGLGWGSGGGWNDATGGGFPDWVQVNFSGTKTIGEIDLFTLQDNIGAPQDPTETLTFSQYGLSSFEVQYWTGSAWIAVPGGNVSGNNKVWNKFSFAPVSTSAIRVWITNALASYSRVIEIEAYSSP